MRWALTMTLLTLATGPVAAEESEAEKLYRGMEQKVRAAKTLRLRFDLSMTDALGKKGHVKGSLVLGAGDRYRAAAEGKLFGQAVQFTEASDGASVKSSGGPEPPKQDRKVMSPKGVGTYFRAALPREGFFLSSLEMERRGERGAELFQLTDFKLAGKEKIGERDTQAIQYALAFKGAGNPLSMKLWLDAVTNLPVKLAITGGKSDWTDLTETYSEFTVDAKVDAQSFELPRR